MFRGKRVGLALGSGSGRGWAHIGAAKALEEAGIGVDCVAGTSMGALVGAFVAAKRLEILEAYAETLDLKRLLKLIDLVFPHAGLLNGRKVTDIVCSMLSFERIEDLPLPYCAVATSLATGQEVILNEGDIMGAVRASISVPGLFIPFTTNHCLLVDGGLVNPVPVSAVRAMGAELVIAVDLNHEIVLNKESKNSPPSRPGGYLQNALKHSLQESKIVDALHHNLKHMGISFCHSPPAIPQTPEQPHIRDVMMTSVLILEKHLTEARLEQHPADLLVRPRLGHVGFVEFYRSQEAIAEGYRAAKETLDQCLAEFG